MNIQGGYFNGTNKNIWSSIKREPQEFTAMINLATVANFKGYTNFTLDYQAINWVEEMREQQLVYMFIDTLFIMTLIVWVFFFKVYSSVVVNANHFRTVEASMYSVEVIGLPTTKDQGYPNQQEVKNHFMKFGDVHSVHLIRDVGRLFNEFKKAEQLLQRLDIKGHLLNLEEADKGAVAEKDKKKLLQLQTLFDKAVEKGHRMNNQNLKLHQFPIAAAIVVFENPKSRERCIRAYEKYSPYYQMNCCKKVPLRLLFRGHYHIHVKPAPEPILMFWENYSKESCKKFVLMFLFSIMLIMILCVNLGLTYSIKWLFESFKIDAYCPK